MFGLLLDVLRSDVVFALSVVLDIRNVDRNEGLLSRMSSSLIETVSNFASQGNCRESLATGN